MNPARGLTRPAHQLVVFEAVARHRSVGAGASELEMAPKDVSRSLRELEEAMGTDLFTRHDGAIGLAQAGKILFLGVSSRLSELRSAAAWLERARADGSESSLVQEGDPTPVAGVHMVPVRVIADPPTSSTKLT